jgi:hypothetical protein
MASASAYTTGSVSLVDPAAVSPSVWAQGSTVLVDPSLLPSSYTTGSVTLVVVEPISGPRVWSHEARRWRSARIVRHEPGITWE